MQSRIVFLFALLVCSQALTLSESTGALYTLNEKRYQELLVRMKEASFSDTRDIHLKTTISSFALTCSQVASLVSTYHFESEGINGLDIIKNNIVDPQNKDLIINSFSKTDAKKQVTDLLTLIPACKTEGVAPEKFPFVALPYKDQWNQTDLDVVIRRINKAFFSDGKLQIAEEALTSSSKILTSEQACLLYESFSFPSDMVALTEFVKDRIVGLTCEEVISILNRFAFQSDKLDALEAFKHTIIDVENKLILVDSFTYTTSKERARYILDDLKPKSYLFGVPTGNVLFLIDVSGSMNATFILSTGQKMNRLDFVRKEVAKTITNFQETTQFNILAYAATVSSWKTDGLQKSSETNIIDAVNFSKNLTANGGTNMYAALQQAWNIDGVDTIYLLTDGSPSVGVTDTSRIISDVKVWNAKTPIKINTIAFLMGTDDSDDKPASRKLMSALAEATNGIYRAIESDQ